MADIAGFGGRVSQEMPTWLLYLHVYTEHFFILLIVQKEESGRK